MKKALSLVLGIMFLVSLGFVSASVVYSETIIGGTIYQDVVTNGVVGANVEVTCNHNSVDYTNTTTSIINGQYSVEFQFGQCTYGDLVTVTAEKGTSTGTNDGSVSMTYGLPGVTLNVGIVNVPLVPEFGTLVGVLTVMGALGLFFVVRRK